jgi:hypothetical protein
MKPKDREGKRNYKPLKIGDSLREINQNLLYKLGKIDYIIYSKWPEIVGVFFVQHSQPEKITIVPDPSLENSGKKRILQVSVTPAAAVEFQHYKNKIIEKINSFFGYQAIHSIKIHQKLVQKNALPNINSKKKYGKDISQKKNEIKNTTKKINDKELQESLLNLGISISTNEEN